MEGAGLSRPDITEQLCSKFPVRPKTVEYYYRTRSQWQPEILGLSEAKESYHQTLNRFEYQYRKSSAIAMRASEDSNKLGALKLMFAITVKKAELTGVLVPGVASEDKPTFQSLLDEEVMDHLTRDENELVLQAASVFMKKRGELLEMREQEKTML